MKPRKFLQFVLTILALSSLPVHGQRAAKAEAQIDTNGVVTAITITDGGGGYATAPVVMVRGGGGTNAIAAASLQDGAVASIEVVYGGQGYTGAPAVSIAPPNAPIATLAMRVRTEQPKPFVEVFGEMGSTLELQAAESLSPGNAWTTIGTSVLTSNSWNFAIPDPAAARRFYRAVVQRVERPERPGNMIWLPPGTFLMGSERAGVDSPSNEGPQTKVRLTQGCFLGLREVSQSKYQSLMGTNPATFQGDTTLPVETVSWEEAMQYCARLTAEELAAGRIPSTWRYRLPTEAEWEYAARAGQTAEYGFPMVEASRYVWHQGDNFNHAQPVGQLQPNAWGFHDLFGNVAEWCLDAYGAYAGGEVTNPAGATNGLYRVVRGGSGRDSLDFLRTAARDARPAAGYRDAWLGFRVALAPQYDIPELIVNPVAVGGSIAGSITNGWNGLAMRGVIVSLASIVSSVTTNGTLTNLPVRLAQTTTGEDGHYAFGSLNPGTYVVSCRLNNPEIVCEFEHAGQTAPPSFAVTSDSVTADFLGYISATGGGDIEDSQFEVSLFLSKLPDNTLLWDESRVSRIYWEAIWEYRERQEYTRHRPIKGITKLQWKATYGYWSPFWGRENSFFSTLTFQALNRYRHEVRMDLPLTGCPQRNNFAWEVSKGRGLWASAGLATPVASPATNLQYPSVFTASWQPVTGAFGYIIEVSADGSFTENWGGAPLASYEVGQVSSAAIDLGLAASLTTPYYYRVIAHGDGVLSEYSAPVRIWLDSVAAPQPAVKEVRRTGLTLNWAAVPGALAYRVQVSTNLAFTEPLFLNRDVGPATTVDVDGLPDATFCYYRVIVTAPRDGPYRDATQFQRGVEALPATSRTATSFVANWKPRLCSTRSPVYDVQVSSDPSFATLAGDYLFPDTQTSTLVFNLPPMKTVYYRVRTRDSSPCNPAESYSTPVEAPCVPLLLAPTGVGATGFTLNWEDIFETTGYRLDLATDPGFANCLLRDLEVGDQSHFVVSNLPPSGLPYFYRLRGCCGAAVGGYSATGTVQFTLPHLIWIPPGTFTMGGTECWINLPFTPFFPAANELPLTQVTLTKGFWMDQFEVTEKEYSELMGGNPPRTGLAAVNYVTWHWANVFCSQLTARERAAGRLPEGFTYRLPTEAEWEYACRAGTHTGFSFEGELRDLTAHAHTLVDCHPWPYVIGGRLPNPWQLYDMHGNVAEWCLDGPWSYPGGSVTDPVGPAESTGAHACRGGSFAQDQDSLGKLYDGDEDYTDWLVDEAARSLGKVSSAARYFWTTSHQALGFRVVLAREP